MNAKKTTKKPAVDTELLTRLAADIDEYAPGPVPDHVIKRLTDDFKMKTTERPKGTVAVAMAGVKTKPTARGLQGALQLWATKARREVLRA